MNMMSGSHPAGVISERAVHDQDRTRTTEGTLYTKQREVIIDQIYTRFNQITH